MQPGRRPSLTRGFADKTSLSGDHWAQSASCAWRTESSFHSVESRWGIIPFGSVVFKLDRAPLLQLAGEAARSLVITTSLWTP
jgi:hypothetical protein